MDFSRRLSSALDSRAPRPSHGRSAQDEGLPGELRRQPRTGQCTLTLAISASRLWSFGAALAVVLAIERRRRSSTQLRPVSTGISAFLDSGRMPQRTDIGFSPALA